MDLEKLKSCLSKTDIEVLEIEEHSKASENYVAIVFHDKPTKYKWSGLIPYYYRRTGLFIETEKELADYLQKIKSYFKKAAIRKWIANEKKLWKKEFKGKTVTKPFFDELAKLKWTSKFPPNDNPQRRIQDIKELGYTMSTRRNGRKTERLLVPIPRGAKTGYETFTEAFKQKAIEVLEYLNSYELNSANKAGLLPDHKFPEIRWDEKTREENPDEMSDDEIKNKFQLLDNQRNQQKREVCRKCFQTGKRGILFGIKFFHKGDENWSTDIPKVGKNAEKGCHGCGWYDIQKWREELNKIVNE